VATKLTPRERKLIKGVAAGKSIKASAIAAGYSPKTGRESGSRALRKVTVKTAMEKLMDRVGLSDAKVFQTHAEMMAATRTVSAISGKDANAGTVDFIEVPDWQARGKAVDMAHKIKGRFVEKKEVSGPDGGAIPVHFTVKFVGE
jgi:phage terminase small subunit